MFNFIGKIIGGVVEFVTHNELARNLVTQTILNAGTKALSDNNSKIDDYIPQALSEIVNNNKISTGTLKKIAKTINDENVHMPNLKVEVADDRTLHFCTIKL